MRVIPQHSDFLFDDKQIRKINIETILLRIFDNNNSSLESNIFRVCILKSFLNGRKIPPIDVFSFITNYFERNIVSDMEKIIKNIDNDVGDSIDFYLNVFVEITESYFLTISDFNPLNFCFNFFNIYMKNSFFHKKPGQLMISKNDIKHDTIYHSENDLQCQV